MSHDARNSTPLEPFHLGGKEPSQHSMLEPGFAYREYPRLALLAEKRIELIDGESEEEGSTLLFTWYPFVIHISYGEAETVPRGACLLSYCCVRRLKATPVPDFVTCEGCGECYCWDGLSLASDFYVANAWDEQNFDDWLLNLFGLFLNDYESLVHCREVGIILRAIAGSNPREPAAD